MLFRAGKTTVADSLPGKFSQPVMASCIGFFSAMVGISGGTFNVPILTAYNYSAHKALGTAAGIGLIISLPAAITMLIFGVTPSDAPSGTYGLVNFFGFVCIVPLTVIFAAMGAKLASVMDASLLKRVFAVVFSFPDCECLYSFLFNIFLKAFFKRFFQKALSDTFIRH